jgi:hypothetical protein
VRTVAAVNLLLDRRSPLVKTGRNNHVRVAKDTDELAGESLVGFGEEGDRLSGTSGATSTTDAVNVLFWGRKGRSAGKRGREGKRTGRTSSMVRGKVWLITSSTLGMSRPRAATSVEGEESQFRGEVTIEGRKYGRKTGEKVEGEEEGRRTGSNKDVALARLEVRQTLRPLVLAHVAVDASDLVPLVPQHIEDPRRLLLVQRENENLLPVGTLSSLALRRVERETVVAEVGEEERLLLSGLVDDDGDLLNTGVGSEGVGTDGDAERGGHEFRGELTDGHGPGGGEHGGLTEKWGEYEKEEEGKEKDEPDGTEARRSPP